jgi:hypothetical protein
MLSLLAFVGLSYNLVSGRAYGNHEQISLVANTVGPFNNPTETYPVSH